jgi:hypothetical protein
VPSSSFDEADIVLHAASVGTHLPFEDSCDESAWGESTWTGEAYVDVAWSGGFDRWSVALDGHSAVAWEVYFGSR